MVSEINPLVWFDSDAPQDIPHADCPRCGNSWPLASLRPVECGWLARRVELIEGADACAPHCPECFADWEAAYGAIPDAEEQAYEAREIRAGRPPLILQHKIRYTLR